MTDLVHGQLDWVNTPDGHIAVGWLLFAALVTVLACLGLRTTRRDRAAREAQEWADLDEWEEQIRENSQSMAEWRRTLRLESEMADADVRRIADEELRAEAARLDRQNPWPQPLSPRLTDWAVSAAAPAPLPARYWLGDSRPIAEVESYAGAAAWFGSDMRAGVDVTDDTVVDAIVPVSGGPRHAWGTSCGTDAQRRDPTFTAWEQSTGAWPIVTRELVNA